jgi:hypothetical protein
VSGSEAEFAITIGSDAENCPIPNCALQLPSDIERPSPPNAPPFRNPHQSNELVVGMLAYLRANVEMPHHSVQNLIDVFRPHVLLGFLEDCVPNELFGVDGKMDDDVSHTCT